MRCHTSTDSLFPYPGRMSRPTGPSTSGAWCTADSGRLSTCDRSDLHLDPEEVGVGARRFANRADVCLGWRQMREPDQELVLFQSSLPSTGDASADDKRGGERIAVRNPLPRMQGERGTSVLVGDQILVVQG